MQPFKLSLFATLPVFKMTLKHKTNKQKPHVLESRRSGILDLLSS